MKKFFSTTLAGLAVVGALSTMALVSTDVDARPYHRGRVGLYIGAPVLAASLWYASRPYYYGYPYGYPYAYGRYGYGPAYYPPVVEQPSVYVEQQPPVAMGSSPPPPSSAPQAQQQQYWYFCQDSQTYYPHVQNCATPWQRVAPHASR